MRPAFLPGFHARIATLALALLVLSACVTRAPATDTLVTGQQASIKGEVVSVDTSPWTYDGSAVVVVSSTQAGNVRVQLPARWNLCKAPPLEDLNAFKAGDGVEVAGTVTAPDELVVCAEPGHYLRRSK